MPIYEYSCIDCGHYLTKLQKITDQPIVTCPACGKSRMRKLVSAAGFQLKGTGWYVTDFRNSTVKTNSDGKEDLTGKKGTDKTEAKAKTEDSVGKEETGKKPAKEKEPRTQ